MELPDHFTARFPCSYRTLEASEAEWSLQSKEEALGRQDFEGTSIVQEVRHRRKWNHRQGRTAVHIRTNWTQTVAGIDESAGSGRKRHNKFHGIRQCL